MRVATLVLGAVLMLVPFGPAQATTIYGSLGNFDCINDTGSTAHKDANWTVTHASPEDVA